MSNLDTWNKVSRPPREALKQIKGGRLAGMTDVNPQWRFKVMTETFGPCGQAWTYTIEKLWTEPGPDGAVMAFALVNLVIRKPDLGMAIPGIGGSAMIAKEKDGLRGNDEAYKMAVTDALSVAMKALGVAADIYAGLWDGTKYRDAPTTPHSGSDGAMESLSPEKQQEARDVAMEVIDFMQKGKILEAAKWIKGANFEADALVAMWALLPSEMRSALKKHQASAKAFEA